MRVLITGAGGFVGQHLIALLREVEPESELLALENSSGQNRSYPEGVRRVACDIRSRAAVQELIAREKPEQIYHLAAISAGGAANREEVFAVNVEGTRCLLDAAASLQPYPRVLLASSGYVYGNTSPHRPAREEDPIGPLWRFGAYTDSKIEMESVARGYRALAIVARPFLHIGPGQAPSFALSSFAQQTARIEKKRMPPVLKTGNTQTLLDLLDVRDVVEAYRLLMWRAETGETYNIATGRATMLYDALQMLLALSPDKIEVQNDPERMRPAAIVCAVGDPSRMASTTGWQPRIALQQTLADLLQYWRAREEEDAEK